MDDETLPSGADDRTELPRPGGHIGKYEILRTLGAGGMGVVWAARDPNLDREVAIKLMRREHASAEQRARLLREARAMARLKHPNVLTVYEVDSDRGRDFIVMELVDGASLDVWLRTRPAARDIWDAMLAAGAGLAAAHDAGLVHRDFKPGNVLRSRDGRVLVTDFGLARSHLGDIAMAATLEPERSQDSVLDVQLTTTGQLLGTPAYMAPEQFEGETDPRTDQFSFCVTAWEALAGERPYRGATLAELREAARSGRPDVDAKLPVGVRAVLARGLAPDPAKRWPDMRSLLAALRRARRRWPRRVFVIAPLVAATAIAAAVLLMPRTHTAPAVPCDAAAAEQAFASAWSPALAADIKAKEPMPAAMTSALDSYRARWLAGYAHACRLADPQRRAALDCYLGRRDEVVVLAETLQRFEPGSLAGLDIWATLEAGDACSGADPIATPPLPDDDRRAKAIDLLANLYGSTMLSPHGVVTDQATLRDQARALHSPAIEARAEEAIAIAAQQTNDLATGARSFQQAADLARAAHDPFTEARARIGLLEIGRLALPAGELPTTAYEDELRAAELAVQRAGNDRALVAWLDASRAAHAVYVEHDVSRGISLAQHAYATLHEIHDHKRGPKVAVDLADYLTIRSKTGDWARAAELVADARSEVKLAGNRNDYAMANLRTPAYWIAWLDGDIQGAHAALDVDPRPAVPETGGITGRVVDERGAPVAGARVVSWHGELFGDAIRAYTENTTLSTTTTDADGRFKLRAPPTGGVIAELGDRRSLPMPARDGTRLVVRSTHTITGHIDAGGDPVVGIEPFVRIDVNAETRWFDSIAPALVGSFTIRGIPEGAQARLGALGTHWPREVARRIDAGAAIDGTTIHWPTGPTLDVIARTSGSVWVFRGDVKADSREQANALAARASDVAVLQLSPIGWQNATDAGGRLYRPGDVHAVVGDNVAGPITVCTAAGGSTVTQCTHLTLTDPISTTERDGRHWFETVSIDQPR